MKASFGFSLRAVLVLLATATIACTPTTSAPTRLPTRHSVPTAAKPYTLKIVAIITRKANKSVNDIAVTATTGNSRLTDNTGSNGAVSLKLPYTPGDSIAFEFKKGSEYWVSNRSNVPHGANRIKVYFELDDAGIISFSRMEY